MLPRLQGPAIQSEPRQLGSFRKGHPLNQGRAMPSGHHRLRPGGVCLILEIFSFFSSSLPFFRLRPCIPSIEKPALDSCLVLSLPNPFPPPSPP
ncbi:hypothetical protein FJTKL_03896 [Diaporthe vaccinii]|uniref:Uncharacterized protein n=1 Tax=Diaporthe vaccinii TaxID=105482 RepID=A0ABR4F1F5_9PEZI